MGRRPDSDRVYLTVPLSLGFGLLFLVIKGPQFVPIAFGVLFGAAIGFPVARFLWRNWPSAESLRPANLVAVARELLHSM